MSDVNHQQMQERVQKLIASAGICSRRKAEELIGQGRVKVNGQIARVGDTVDPDKDKITVDGKPITPEPKVYFALNKPVGYECTLKSTHSLPTVIELIETSARIFPVGRLDADSRGLILLTNDGKFAHLVMHPCSSIDKAYRVSVNGTVSDERIERMRQGIELEEARTWPCEIEVLERDCDKTVMRFVLHEGRKRQIRRMIGKMGFRVMDLCRERVGNLSLEDLREGQYRNLEKHEVQELINLTGQGS